MWRPAQIESQIPPNNLISCHYFSQIRCQSRASGIRNQSLARIWHVFPLIFLLLGQPRGESIVMRTFKLATLIISRPCLRIHLCKHYANVFSALSLESDRALPAWREPDWCSLDVTVPRPPNAAERACLNLCFKSWKVLLIHKALGRWIDWAWWVNYNHIT